MEESRFEMLEAEVQDLRRATVALDGRIGSFESWARGFLAALALLVAITSGFLFHLASRIDALGQDVVAFRVAGQEQVVQLREIVAGLRSDVQHLRSEDASIRLEMREEHAQMRAEHEAMRAGFESLRQEIRALHTD